MLVWSDFEVAKATHKEREQAAQQGWLLKQAQVTAQGTDSFSQRFGRWLMDLKLVAPQRQDDKHIVCC